MEELDWSAFAYPNPQCPLFDQPGQGNLRPHGWSSKPRNIRCTRCGKNFSGAKAKVPGTFSGRSSRKRFLPPSLSFDRRPGPELPTTCSLEIRQDHLHRFSDTPSLKRVSPALAQPAEAPFRGQHVVADVRRATLFILGFGRRQAKALVLEYPRSEPPGGHSPTGTLPLALRRGNSRGRARFLASAEARKTPCAPPLGKPNNDSVE